MLASQSQAKALKYLRLRAGAGDRFSDPWLGPDSAIPAIWLVPLDGWSVGIAAELRNQVSQALDLCFC